VCQTILDFRFCEKFDRRLPAIKAFQDGFWIDPTVYTAFLYHQGMIGHAAIATSPKTKTRQSRFAALAPTASA
jgi:hypothetical protein